MFDEKQYILMSSGLFVVYMQHILILYPYINNLYQYSLIKKINNYLLNFVEYRKIQTYLRLGGRGYPYRCIRPERLIFN